MSSLAAAAPAHRLRRSWRRARRAVLRRRRLLAALLVALAVVAGVRAVAAPPPAAVPVVVAAHDLASGAVVTDDDLTVARFAPGTAPQGVLAHPAGVTLAAPVRAGEPVTDVRVLGDGPATGLDGAVATPVRLPDAAMAALLAVGDRLDLVVTDPAEGTASTVALDVPVLALPTPPDGSDAGGSALPGRLVVLGLDAGDVDEVSAAAAAAFVTFTWA